MFVKGKFLEMVHPLKNPRLNTVNVPDALIKVQFWSKIIKIKSEFNPISKIN